MVNTVTIHTDEYLRLAHKAGCFSEDIVFVELGYKQFSVVSKESLYKDLISEIENLRRENNKLEFELARLKKRKWFWSR